MQPASQTAQPVLDWPDIPRFLQVTCPANCNHKWLDFNKGDLVLTFDSAVEVASYDWMTANDAPARDPSAWTLEGSNDGSSWTVVDDSAAGGVDVTGERYMFLGPFCINQAGAGGGGGQVCVGPIETGNTQSYDNILSDLPLGDDKAITFTVQVCYMRHLILMNHFQQHRTDATRSLCCSPRTTPTSASSARLRKPLRFTRSCSAAGATADRRSDRRTKVRARPGS